MYTEKVMEHFTNPRNVGAMDDPDAVGDVGSLECGDNMIIYIKVKEGKLAEIKFQTFGCAAAIASSSMLTEMAKGMTLDEAEAITKEDVADSLDGLPAKKMHCSNMAADALKKAIENYRAAHQ